MNSTVLDLLDRTRTAAKAKAADNDARYAKLVQRCARGEAVAPDSVLTSLTTWGRTAEEFADDVTYVADRLALRAVADEAGARTRAARAAADRHAQLVSEWEAAAAALNAEWAARAEATDAEKAAAEAAVKAAQDAHGRLARECQDAELIARLRELDAERMRAAQALDAVRGGIGFNAGEIRETRNSLQLTRHADPDGRAAAKIARLEKETAELIPRLAPVVAGVAHVFDKLTRFDPGAGIGLSRLDRYGTLACFVQASAVDASIRLARRGIGEIKLLFDHDIGQELASTADGSLAVFRDANRLFFLVRTSTARGRAAVRRIAARPSRRECSIGGNIPRGGLDRLSGGKVWDLVGMDLDEISIVRRGANTGTCVKIV